MTTTADLHAKAAAAYARIQGDSRLTPEAKRADLLRVWSQLDRDLTALRVADEAAKTARRTALEQQLFGLPATATSYDRMARRDAQQRADSLESEGAAARMMSSARRAGDMELVNAVAARAVSEGWRNLAEAYVAEVRPSASDSVRELLQPEARGLTFVQYGDYVAPPPLSGRVDQLQAEVAALDAADGIYRLPSPDAAHTTPSRLESLASQPDAHVARDELEQFAIDLMNARTASPVDDIDSLTSSDSTGDAA